MSLWSVHPGKRGAQRFYLLFTPIWGAVCGLVMTTGFAERWEDGGLLVLGFALWIALLAGGLHFAPDSERARPLHRRYHVKLSVFVAVLAFIGNYFGTRYFYEILDMHYGFRTSVYLNDVPFFLYPLTAVYFTTYAVLLELALRCARARGVSRSVALVLVSFTLAALETALNANPSMARAFCYGDLRFALGFGTVMYGLHFVITGPLWCRIDEGDGVDTPLREVLGSVLAASMLIQGADEFFLKAIAPSFTTVVRGRVGVPGKQGPSCLR